MGISRVKIEFSRWGRDVPELLSDKLKVIQQESTTQRRISGFWKPTLDHLFSTHMASFHTLLLVDYFGFVLLEFRYSLHLLISQYFEVLLIGCHVEFMLLWWMWITYSHTYLHSEITRLKCTVLLLNKNMTATLRITILLL